MTSRRGAPANPDHVPVIAAIGECIERGFDPASATDPIGLVAQAVRNAEADAGAAIAAAVDSLYLVNLFSWNYRDPVALLASRLGIDPALKHYATVGGESPLRLIEQAASRIASGQSAAAVIAGGEAQYSVTSALREGVSLPWPPQEGAPRAMRGDAYLHPLAVVLDMTVPVRGYPFYETASAAKWGQTPYEAQSESAILWSRLAAIAAENPTAWTRKALPATAIIEPSGSNRPICWPYTKYMVANPMVNQAGAIVLTSLSFARRLGIAEDRLVIVRGSSFASEPEDYLSRDQYHESHAMNAVINSIMDVADRGDCPLEAFELYSCFPCVPKMARRAFGLGADVEPSVTGGLSFFGAPVSNYMTHAACAMVRALRSGRRSGVLYGQGKFVTHHRALLLAGPTEAARSYEVRDAQADADRCRGTIPGIDCTPDGKATVEASTIVFDRHGEAGQGIVIARTADGARTMARIPVCHTDDIRRLMSLDIGVVGAAGKVTTPSGATPEWQFS